MRLAGDDDLDRHIRMRQDALEPFDVAEQQRGALVGGKAAREADGQHVWLEHLAQPPHFGGRRLPVHGRMLHALADELHQTALAAPVCFPKLGVRNLANAFPRFRVSVILEPIRLQILIVERRQFPAHPGRQVYAVGHRRDGHFLRGKLRPHVLEHLARHVAVQAAHRVAVAGGIERADGHRKPLGRIVAMPPAQAHQRVERNLGFLAIAVEVLEHQRGIEQIETGRHRRVRGEHVVAARSLERLLKRQAAVAHEQPDALDGEEPRVPLVHVIGGGLEPQRRQGAQAADAQHDLLTHPHVQIAAVQPVRDVAVVAIGVLRQVGVQ